MRGLDYAWSHVPPAAVKAAGFGFAARYLSHDASKNLTKLEAFSLISLGVAIVLVWEDTAQGALRGHAGGVADALAADSQARACGLPGAFIYFAADWDVTPAQQAAVNAYLDGCASIIGMARVGLYGGFWPCSRAREVHRASKYWGTLAWSGSNWANTTFTPDVMQGAQVTIDGVSVDLDTGGAAGPDFGQWPRPALTAAPAPAAVPALEEPDMILLTIDKATVPAGPAWPGVWSYSGGVLAHVPLPSDESALLAAGVKNVTVSFGYWVSLGGKPSAPVIA
jgi:hypothetical protein